MKILTLKMRILVLWIFTAVSITAESALFLYEKGWIEKLITGELGIGPGTLVLWTCRWLIPFVLAFLTVTLRDKANRMTNLVFAAVFLAFNVFQFIMRVVEQQALPPFLIIIIVSSIVAAALILWHAIRWTKYEE